MDSARLQWLLVTLPAVVLAALLVGTALFAAGGRLRRNGWLGIRTSATLASDAAWRAAHRSAGRWWLSGLVLTTALGVSAAAIAQTAVSTVLVVCAFTVLAGCFVGGSAAGVLRARSAG